MDKRLAAEWLAKRGFPVFPLVAGRKIPTRPKWQQLSTTDVEAVRAMWTRKDGEAADYNPGIHGKSHVILDADAPGDSHKSQFNGLEALKALGWHGRTFTVRTPSGGLHLYFKKPAGVDFSQSDIAPGINVRSSGGFVCGPGSWTFAIPGKQVEGQYIIVDQTLPAELPDCFLHLLRPAGEALSFDESTFDGQWDHPHAVEWCWRFIREWAPTAQQGNRGITGLNIAHTLGDHAISQALALDMLQVWHAEKADPPEDPENQMAHVLASAYRGRKAPFGRLCAHDVFTPIEIPIEELDEPARIAKQIYSKRDDVPIAQRVRRTELKSRSDVAKIPGIPWLIRGKLIRGTVTTLVAPPGAGKSTLTLGWAIALAIGSGAFIGLPQIENAPPVASLIIGVEDPHNIVQMRIAAACEHHGLDFEAVHKHVHVISAQDTGDLNLMRKKDRRSLLTTTKHAEELIAHILRNKIEFVVLDPLIEFHDGEENDNGEMRRVMGLVRDVARISGASVLIVHHTRKPPQGSSENYAGDANAGRGASAIVGAIRSGFTLFGASLKDCELYDEINEENRIDYVRFDDAKASWARMTPQATWFKRVSVQLENGEAQPAFERAHLTKSGDKSDSMLAEDVAEMLKPNVETALSAVALALTARAPYKEKGERTVRRKLGSAFAAGETKTTRGIIRFSPSGKEGGTLLLTSN